MKPPKQTKQQYQALITSSTTNLLDPSTTITTPSPTAKGDAYVSSIRSLLSSLPYQECIEVCGKTGDKGQDIRIEGNGKTLIIQAKLDKSHSGPEGIRGEISKVVNGGLLKQGESTIFCYVTNNEISSDIVEKVKAGLAEDRKWVDLRVFRVRHQSFADASIKKEASETELLELALDTVSRDYTMTFETAPSAVSFYTLANGEQAPGMVLGIVSDSELSKYNELLLAENARNNFYRYNPRNRILRKNKVNTAIEETKTKAAHMMLARNNGITMVCDGYVIDPIDPRKVTIKKPRNSRVLNGGQSYSVMSEGRPTGALITLRLCIIPSDGNAKYEETVNETSKCLNDSTPVHSQLSVWNSSAVHNLCEDFYAAHKIRIACNDGKLEKDEAKVSAQSLFSVLVSLYSPGLGLDASGGGCDNQKDRSTRWFMNNSKEERVKQIYVAHLLQQFTQGIQSKLVSAQKARVADADTKIFPYARKQLACLVVYALSDIHNISPNGVAGLDEFLQTVAFPAASMEKLRKTLENPSKVEGLQDRLALVLARYLDKEEKRSIHNEVASKDKTVTQIQKQRNFLVDDREYSNFCVLMEGIKNGWET